MISCSGPRAWRVGYFGLQAETEHSMVHCGGYSLSSLPHMHRVIKDDGRFVSRYPIQVGGTFDGVGWRGPAVAVFLVVTYDDTLVVSLLP
jgi:hypothetical protein